jgi:hypothetical protein
MSADIARTAAVMDERFGADLRLALVDAGWTVVERLLELTANMDSARSAASAPKAA